MNYPKDLLMVSPEYFDVVYQINDHMNLENKVDKTLAAKQWGTLKSTYESLGMNVIVVPGSSSFPDMVFAANQLFTTPTQTFLSQIKHPERRGEVAYLKSFLKLENSIQVNSGFESMGDLLWDYAGERLFGGYGFRTDPNSYDEINEKINYSIRKIMLTNSTFYHLDTCLSIINKNTAMYVRSAFSKETISQLKNDFVDLIEVDELEAKNYLACNAHSPDGEHILIEKSAIKLQSDCKMRGFKVIGIDTSEFLKSGGSIFCLKNQGWFRN